MYVLRYISLSARITAFFVVVKHYNYVINTYLLNECISVVSQHLNCNSGFLRNLYVDSQTYTIGLLLENKSPKKVKN